MRNFSINMVVAIAIIFTPYVATAKVLSKSVAKVTQVKIVHSEGAGIARQNAWGIDSTYIGPGDINRLKSIDIFLNTRGEISMVKVTRTTIMGDTVTQVFSAVLELSIQTLKDGETRPFHATPITVRDAKDLTFP